MMIFGDAASNLHLTASKISIINERIWNDMNKRIDWSRRKAIDLYSVGAEFESLSGHWLS
jgi:hypothetical protein